MICNPPSEIGWQCSKNHLLKGEILSLKVSTEIHANQSYKKCVPYRWQKDIVYSTHSQLRLICEQK